mgnify:CR=1 FL=1
MQRQLQPKINLSLCSLSSLLLSFRMRGLFNNSPKIKLLDHMRIAWFCRGLVLQWWQFSGRSDDEVCILIMHYV